MSIKPILFNQKMVKAILDGRKMVTRRLLKGYALDHLEIDTDNSVIGIYDQNEGYVRPIEDFEKYQVKDILWVQETWKVDSINSRLNNMLIDFRALQSGYSQAEVSADFTKERFDKFKKFYQKNGWQSPYFMPREATRIFLEVTNVRVERLQDITDEQIIKEGLSPYDDICQDVNWKPTLNDPDSGGDPNLKQGFEILWDSAVKEDWQKFESNPWVWVYEFECCEKPKGWC